MSAFDLLSRADQARILAEGRAQTERYGELAAAALAEPGFVERLGVYLLGPAGSKTPYDPEPLDKLRRELREALEAFVRYGRGADGG